MNQDRENKLPGSESDPIVSAEYRAIATDRPPPELDAAVLKKAEAAASESGLQGFTAFWFRPLAFVASLGLALALVLELTSVESLQPAMDPSIEAGRHQPEILQAVPSDEANEPNINVYRKPDSPTGKRQSAEAPAPASLTSSNVEESGRRRVEINPAAVNEDQPLQTPASDATPVVDERISADFADMIEASSKRMQDQESVTKTAIQNRNQIGGAQDVQAGNVVGARSSAAAFAVAPRPCTEEQIAIALTWWQCISDLEEAGRQDEVKAELDLFNKAHPDFNAPEILPSQ